MPQNSSSGMPLGEKRWISICMTLFGVSLSTNVVYLIKIGNTCVYVGYVVALVFLIALILKDCRKGCLQLELVDKSIWVFFALACLSIISSTAYVFSGSLPIEAPIVVLRGIIVLVSGLAVYYIIVRLPHYSTDVIVGLAIGVVVNGIVSIVQLIFFESNSFFTLFYLFPQDAFEIPAKWGIWSMLPEGVTGLVKFRAQGLFLEASQLMVFLICVVPISFLSSRSDVLRIVLVLCAVFCCVTSLSANAALFVAEIIILASLLFLGTPKSSNLSLLRLSRVGIIAIPAVAFLVLLILLFNSEALLSALAGMGQSMGDINLFSSSDTGTVERWDSMQKTFEVCASYLFGTGWNTESLTLSYVYGFSDLASYNYAIRLLLELGVLGLIFYIIVIWRHSKPLFVSGATKTTLCLGLSVIFLFVCQVTNGITLVPWAWALLGLARVKSLELKRK